MFAVINNNRKMKKQIAKIISRLFEFFPKKTNALLRRIYLYRFAECSKDVSFYPLYSNFLYNNIHIGEGTHIGKGANFLSSIAHIYIGKKVMFGPNVTIRGGNHVFDYPGRFIIDITENEKRPTDDEDVVIEDDVWVGTNVTILKGVKIGRGCIVAAGSVLTKSFPPYCIIAGVPGKVINSRFKTLEDTIVHDSTLWPSNRISDSELFKTFNQFSRKK